jgi:hypothetical protein
MEMRGKREGREGRRDGGRDLLELTKGLDDVSGGAGTLGDVPGGREGGREGVRKTFFGR